MLRRPEEHAALIQEFLEQGGTNRMFACVRGVRLEMSSALPAVWQQVVYFAIPRTKHALKGDYDRHIQTGEVAPQRGFSLLDCRQLQRLWRCV